MRGLGGIRGLGLPREDFISIEREPEFRVPSFDYVAPTLNEDAINKALEAVTVRKEANDAINNATDQYEADVADFKNTQATEIEQGIATLPEILNLSETPFVPEGIGSFTPPSDPVIPRMPNEISVPFDPPPSIDVPGGGGITYDSIGMPLVDPEPFIGTGRGGREDFVRDLDERDFRDTGFGDYIIEDPIIPPMTPPTDPVIPVDGLPGTPGFFDQFPGITPPGSGNPYEGIFDNIVEPPPIIIGPPGIAPPFDPPFDPPYDPPITDPDPIVPPIDEGPTGPINYYTGKPVKNPYIPYSTDSGTAPLTRTIDPETFGQAPGFESSPIVLPPAPPEPPKPKPPIMCFVAGTKVDMADGTKKVIENIVVGDEVMALGNKIDKVSYVHDIPKDNRNLWTINNRITATDSHAFLTKDGWKSNNAKLSNTVYNDYGIEVKDLQIGDKLITNDGVEKVTTLESEKDFVKVYNFSTANTHTYLVDGVVSHNKLPPRVLPFPEELRPIAMAPKGAKAGGYLNNGISMLPMNGQGDTLTTQVFQSGFRPRR